MGNTSKSAVVPFRVWTRRVETQHRVRLGKDACDSVPWLKPVDDFSVACIARIGPVGQMQVFPRASDDPTWEAFRASLTASPAVVDDIGAPWLDVARYLAGTWHVTWTFESGRFTMVLPKEARDLGIVTGESSVVVVFSTGLILEIWPCVQYIQHVAKLVSDPVRLRALAHDIDEARGLADESGSRSGS